ncbi:MAG: FAD-binding oxidoreductase [Acidobacteria bacterium]|nr:FAD-binding oxidoreductase [Acidobacteriota bacterium]
MSKSDCDVAVIGAGVIGCSISWELLNEGLSVELIDFNETPFQGSSLAGFGSLTPYSDPYFVGEAREFAAHSVDLYRNEWIPAISKLIGSQIPFCNDGLIELFPDETSFQKGVELAAELNACRDGITKVLTVSQTRDLEPALSGDYVGALWFDEPWLDKSVYFAALEKLLRARLNNKFRLGKAVSEVSCESDSVHILLSNGDEIKCSNLIVCTGLSETHIVGLPTQSNLTWIRGDAIGLFTRDNLPLIKRHIYMGSGFITPRTNGYMLLGATYEEEHGLPSDHMLRSRDRICVSQFNSIIESNERIIPILKECEVSNVWRGWRPSPPDRMPLLGIAENSPNIIVANGFIGLGITMAPAVARTIADYLVRGKNRFLISFNPNRTFS